MSIDADFTYIDGLEVANPTAGDPRSEGDDHLRGIKTAVKGTFPNIGAAAVTGTAAELNVNTGVTGGTVTASKTVVVDGSKDIGTFGTVTAAAFKGTTSIATAAGAVITEFSIDGTMAGNSDVHVPTEKAVKTYADAAIAAAVTVYSGKVNSDGTASNLPSLPSQWTSSEGTAGNYTIAHKLGTADINVVATEDGLTRGEIRVHSITSTEFQVDSINQSGAALSRSFYFIVQEF